MILHGDCLDLMKTLPDKSIDLFICDLPYGCLSTGNPVRKRFINGKDTGTLLQGQTIGDCRWDNKIDLEKFWEQVERLMKNYHTPIIHFCNTRFGYELIKSKESWFRYDLVWEKPQGVGFLNANKQPLRSHENIYVFSKQATTYYRKDIEKKCIKSIFTFANKKGKGNHPTQKPLDLYKFIIERYSKEGDMILDPTAGSFTSGLASKQLNRNYIGIEMNKDFYDKGIKLLE